MNDTVVIDSINYSTEAIQYMTLDQFFEILIYISSKSWINYLSIGVWFVKIGQYLAEIQLNLKI